MDLKASNSCCALYLFALVTLKDATVFVEREKELEYQNLIANCMVFAVSYYLTYNEYLEILDPLEIQSETMLQNYVDHCEPAIKKQSLISK